MTPAQPQGALQHKTPLSTVCSQLPWGQVSYADHNKRKNPWSVVKSPIQMLDFCTLTELLFRGAETIIYFNDFLVEIRVSASSGCEREQ
jgi:hypothetical protein